ncbi:hypothetical protein BGZ99_002656 [Dissophora globulifera]|uniref:Uncharacterized protein n=1 Tax=Dissophora globulifera TaxID=979702 RepID=A0A9P6UW76_9FUNG|nr:hypothetical protein BGZ99_002656 [Dissophora globulifera]
MAEPSLRVSERLRTRAETRVYCDSEDSEHYHEQSISEDVQASSTRSTATSKGRRTTASAPKAPRRRPNDQHSTSGKTLFKSMTSGQSAKATPVVSSKRKKNADYLATEKDYSRSEREVHIGEHTSVSDSDSGSECEQYDRSRKQSSRAPQKAKALPARVRKIMKVPRVKSEKGSPSLESSALDWQPSSIFAESAEHATDDQLATGVQQWLVNLITGMVYAFGGAREHYHTPLSTLIYWMPRSTPADPAVIHMGDAGMMNYWTIAVKHPDEPWATATILERFRADQVAHWLHITMQELVGFLSLCTVNEARTLNRYLLFRRDFMHAISTMPLCYEWINANAPPQPGDHVYELLLRLRSLDDENQRLLLWILHHSIECRRNLLDQGSFPRNAPFVFAIRTHRSLFEYMLKAWFLYRAKTSPIFDWHAGNLIRDFKDHRSPSRWYLSENLPVDELAIKDCQACIDHDMMYRSMVEKDRREYLINNMIHDEVQHAILDTRPLFSHQLLVSSSTSTIAVESGEHLLAGEIKAHYVVQSPHGQAGLRSHRERRDVGELEEIVQWHLAHLSIDADRMQNLGIGTSGTGLQHHLQQQQQLLQQQQQQQLQQQQQHQQLQSYLQQQYHKVGVALGDIMGPDLRKHDPKASGQA